MVTQLKSLSGYIERWNFSNSSSVSLFLQALWYEGLFLICYLNLEIYNTSGVRDRKQTQITLSHY